MLPEEIPYKIKNPHREKELRSILDNQHHPPQGKTANEENLPALSFSTHMVFARKLHSVKVVNTRHLHKYSKSIGLYCLQDAFICHHCKKYDN